MNNTMKKIFVFTFSIIFSSWLITGCKKDKGDPPVLPPQESMVIDFSNFASLKKGESFPSGIKGTENSTFEFAAMVAGVWKLIINTTLVVPVTAFKASFSQTPEYLDNKTWQWSYTTTVASVVYKARLTGQIGANEVIWKMYISKEGSGGFTEFLWLDGTSKVDGAGGEWVLYKSAQDPKAVLQINWTRTGDKIGKVIYTWVGTGDPFKSSYIEYGLTSATDAYFLVHYYTGARFSDVEIRWNPSTKNGKIKSLEYLENKWYCWDSNKINVTCL
jgi:hypothetical protein